MATFRIKSALLVALTLATSVAPAHAGEWEYYEDSDGTSYYHESGSDGSSRGDVAAALALGVVGGAALGVLAARPAPPRQVIVREEPDCYRAWRRVWDDYYGVYRRSRVLVCE